MVPTSWRHERQHEDHFGRRDAERTPDLVQHRRLVALPASGLSLMKTAALVRRSHA